MDDALPFSTERFLELFERNGHVIYPVIAVGVIALILWGILSAWRTQELDGLAKVELKRKIVIELRKQVGGLSAEALARVVGLDSFKTVKLLDEMQRDGLLVSHTNTARLTTYRIKGAA